MVEFLLAKGAVPTINKQDISPVDVAGFSGHVEVVKAFCNLEVKSGRAINAEGEIAATAPPQNANLNKVAPHSMDGNAAEDVEKTLIKCKKISKS